VRMMKERYEGEEKGPRGKLTEIYSWRTCGVYEGVRF